MTLCYYCKQPLTRGGTQKPRAATWDHRVPKSRGGGGGANKVRCCFQCNNRKGDMTEEEFTQKPLKGSGGPSTLTISRAVKLQRKLNSIFISKRDSYQPIEQIYGHLKRVEGWLSARGAIW